MITLANQEIRFLKKETRDIYTEMGCTQKTYTNPYEATPVSSEEMDACFEEYLQQEQEKEAEVYSQQDAKIIAFTSSVFDMLNEKKLELELELNECEVKIKTEQVRKIVYERKLEESKVTQTALKSSIWKIKEQAQESKAQESKANESKLAELQFRLDGCMKKMQLNTNLYQKEKTSIADEEQKIVKLVPQIKRYMEWMNVLSNGTSIETDATFAIFCLDTLQKEQEAKKIQQAEKKVYKPAYVMPEWREATTNKKGQLQGKTKKGKNNKPKKVVVVASARVVEVQAKIKALEQEERSEKETKRQQEALSMMNEKEIARQADAERLDSEIEVEEVPVIVASKEQENLFDLYIKTSKKQAKKEIKKQKKAKAEWQQKAEEKKQKKEKAAVIINSSICDFCNMLKICPQNKDFEYVTICTECAIKQKERSLMARNKKSRFCMSVHYGSRFVCAHGSKCNFIHSIHEEHTVAQCSFFCNGGRCAKVVNIAKNVYKNNGKQKNPCDRFHGEETYKSYCDRLDIDYNKVSVQLKATAVTKAVAEKKIVTKAAIKLTPLQAAIQKLNEKFQTKVDIVHPIKKSKWDVVKVEDMPVPVRKSRFEKIVFVPTVVFVEKLQMNIKLAPWAHLALDRIKSRK
jgi:hypothetical protein